MRLMNPSNCPTLRAKVLSNCGPGALRYWEFLGCTQVDKDHSRCADQGCIANDLDIASYVTRHTTGSCTCPFQEPDANIIADIYARGSFPLVSIKRSWSIDDVQSISIQVKAYDPAEATPFIAISHALAGGLGNPQRPALPACQLLRLDTWVRKIDKTQLRAPHQDWTSDKSTIDLDEINVHTAASWFWMDSLCIPSHTTITSQYDMKARRSFKRATSLSVATLVIDEDILKIQSESRPEEAYMRIVYSSWFDRMWTLQEAVATPMVLFQIGDSILDLDELVSLLGVATSTQNCETHTDLAGFNDYRSDTCLRECHLDLTPLHDLQELREYMINPAYECLRGTPAHEDLLERALSQRKTSYSDDKAVIWANLLDLIMPLSRQNSASLAY